MVLLEGFLRFVVVVVVVVVFTSRRQDKEKWTFYES